MSLSVIIPVHNGGENFRQCLESLAASTYLPDEVIVVDDASTDGSGDLARQNGARVVRLDGTPRGPAFARNRGAQIARGNLLVFFDADVAIHPDTLTRMEQHLADLSDVAAIFGSYDDDPPSAGLVSRYKNLLHHYIHQHGRREASTFWTGCGAIRRDVFSAMGGFDEGCAMMEDIELGGRLRQAGWRVWLRPDVQVTHLKRWTFASLLRSDIRDRAIPWTRLILRDRHLPADLNVGLAGRLSAVAAWMVPVCLVLGLWWHWAWVGALGGLVTLGMLNADLYRFFVRRGGIRFAGGAAILHIFYLLYSSLTFVLIAVPNGLARHGLVLLLGVTLLKGLTWSIVIPPWHAPDEQQHFLYGQSVERWQTLRVAPSLWVPQDAQQLFALIQFNKVRYAGQPLDLADRVGIAAQIARLNNRGIRWTIVYDQDRQLIRIRNFSAFHPPLYYALLGIVQWPLEETSILVRQLACRWLSVMLGMVAVVVAYYAGRELWPDQTGRALLVATLVSFQPMFTFCMAIVSNGALEITLFSTCLLVSLRVIRQRLNWVRGLVLGLLIGLGLLTKISFLSILPLVGLLFLWDTFQGKRRRLGWRAMAPWALVVLIPVLLAGWWYDSAIFSGGDTLISNYGSINTQSTPSLVSYLLHYDWLTVYRRVLNMYWGYFGWLDTPLPNWLWRLLEWITIIVIWTIGWWFVRRLIPRSRRRERDMPAFTLFFLGCATLAIVAFYTYLDYRSVGDLGKPFGIQGRYYLPAIIGQMVWLLLGLLEPVPERLRRAWMSLLGAGMVALNLYALFGVIAPRYYGSRDLWIIFERANVLQPVRLAVLVTICTGTAVLTLALLVALVGSWSLEKTPGS